MKKFFTILLAGLAVHQVQSQTITSANLPIIGEAWIEFIDATGGLVTITAGGAGQTWNYGTSFNVADTSAFLFESPNNAPAIMNASINFPNANLTVNEFLEDTSLSVYIYSTDFYKTNATGLYIDGLVFAAPPGYWFKRDYNPDLLIIPVPFALNDTRANNALYQQQYTVNLGPPVGLVTENHKSYTIQDFVADATGTLTTPLGTFNNVLRIKEFSYYIDSTIYSVPSIPTEVSISDTTITYQFVQTNSHCLLMS
jgi:hypothetical protein